MKVSRALGKLISVDRDILQRDTAPPDSDRGTLLREAAGDGEAAAPSDKRQHLCRSLRFRGNILTLRAASSALGRPRKPSAEKNTPPFDDRSIYQADVRSDCVCVYVRVRA